MDIRDGIFPQIAIARRYIWNIGILENGKNKCDALIIRRNWIKGSWNTT